MGELGQRSAQRLEDEHVHGQVVQPVRAPHDRRDPHRGVVDAGGEVVRGPAVGTQERDLAHVLPGDFDLAEDAVVHLHPAVVRDTEAENGLDPHDGIGRTPVRGLRSLPVLAPFPLVHLDVGYGRGVVPVGVPRDDEGVGSLPVRDGPLGRDVGRAGTVHVPALVPVDTETGEDGREVPGRDGLSAGVGVVETQDEAAAPRPHVQPGQQGGAGVSDRLMAGGRRGVAPPDLSHAGSPPVGIGTQYGGEGRSPPDHARFDERG